MLWVLQIVQDEERQLCLLAGWLQTQYNLYLQSATSRLLVLHTVHIQVLSKLHINSTNSRVGTGDFQEYCLPKWFTL